MADIDKKQSNEHYQMLPVIAGGCCVVALVIALCFAYQTFFAQTIRVPETINVNIVDAKGHGKELSAEGKAYVKEQLHTALMEVSGKAESAYNEKFAALLTVLSIFGIAWPLILGFLQFRFNEREINKIDESADKITGIEQTAKNAEEQANNAKEQANKAEEITKDVEQKTKEVEEKINEAEQAAKKAEERAVSAEDAASLAFASALENQTVLDELKSIKNDIYNDFPFVFQTLASYFSYVKNIDVTEEETKDYIMFFVFELEMGLKGLYYACLLGDAEVISDMEKRVLKHFVKFDEFMEQKKITERQTVNHLDSFKWETVVSKIDPNSYKRIKDIYDKRFCEKGA